MKTKKISWQAIAIVALALVLIAAIALGVSGAWFQDKDTGNSEAKLGHAVELKLQDVTDGTATDGIKGWKELYNSAKTAAYPGDVIIGKTQIKMNSDTPAVVRAKITPTIKDQSASTVTLDGTAPEAIDGTSVTASSDAAALQAYYDKLVALKYTDKTKYDELAPIWNKFLLANMTTGLNLNTSLWEGPSTAGWMYYKSVYGNLTTPSAGTADVIALFESAKLNPLLTNEVQLWTITIDLEVEAIQAANLKDNATWYGDLTAGIKNAVDTYNTGREAAGA